MAHLRVLVWALLAVVACVATSVARAAPPRDDDERERPGTTVYDFADGFAMGELSATPGGAQDVAFFRDRVRDGEIPHPAVFTPEGLLSEHDLPLRAGRKCRRLLCARGEATEARLVVEPEVRILGQIGFSTNLDARTFRRAPLDLVAVVDVSGSMTGELPKVRAGLQEVARQLGPDDRLSIVAYGDRAVVLVPPTRAEGVGQRRRDPVPG